MPLLRERKEDIGVFLDHFLRKHALELHKTAPTLANSVVETLIAYDWPGNIRELENLVRKMVALGNIETALSDIQIKKADPQGSPKIGECFSLKYAARAASREREREVILEALERAK